MADLSPLFIFTKKVGRRPSCFHIDCASHLQSCYNERVYRTGKRHAVEASSGREWSCRSRKWKRSPRIQIKVCEPICRSGATQRTSWTGRTSFRDLKNATGKFVHTSHTMP